MWAFIAFSNLNEEISNAVLTPTKSQLLFTILFYYYGREEGSI